MLSAQADIDHFWAFSNTLYTRPGVEEALLDLQDREGLEVNLVLFCFYAAEMGVSLDGDIIAGARHIGEAWGMGLISPLREARRRLKKLAEADGEGEAGNVTLLRDKVKRAELTAEKGMQAALSELLQGRRRSAQFGRALAERNVTAWLAAEHMPMTISRARAFTALMDTAFG